MNGVERRGGRGDGGERSEEGEIDKDNEEGNKTDNKRESSS